jgi:RHS repeat-associated protein
MVDDAGALVSRYTYGAFGQPGPVTGASTNPFTYTGRPFDPASATYDLRARAYDPGLGRFLSEDPVPAINLYPYALNDPISLIDPLGAMAATEYGAISQKRTQEVARVQAIAQQQANLGRAHLLTKLSQAERAALAKQPYLERMYLGQAVHRATADILRSAGYRYSTLGPDFVTTIGGAPLYIELTTPLQVAAHMARGGLYSIAKIITYVLP